MCRATNPAWTFLFSNASALVMEVGGALQHGVVPATRNLKNLDPDVHLDVVAGSPRPGNYRYALSNSFGFGGHNVCLAFGRY